LQSFLVELRPVMLTVYLSPGKILCHISGLPLAILLVMANVEKTVFMVKKDRLCVCEVNTILYLLLKCVVVSVR